MHIRKYLSIFLISLVFAIAGCSSSTDSGIGDLEKSLDTDGDGIANEHDGDMDGDGKPNGNDDDIDGDGILNKDDTDDDGDGTDDANDKTAEGPGDNSQSKKNCADNGGTWNDVSNQCDWIVADPKLDVCINSGGIWDDDQCTAQEVANPCTSAKIITPNNDLQTGTKTKVKWKFQPEGCELTEESNVKIQVTAFNQYAHPATEKTGTPHVGKGHGQITIPNNCNWDRTTTKKITYDFSALGIALGDKTASKSRAYIQDVTHPVGRGTCENVEKPPVVALERISHHKDASCEADPYSGAVSCTGATSPSHDQLFYYVWTRITNYPVIDDYPDPPTWKATGVRFMKIYLKKSGEQDRTIKYYGRGSSEWADLLVANAGWQLKKVSPSISGWESPEKGNFFLQIGTEDTTISKYHIPTP